MSFVYFLPRFLTPFPLSAFSFELSAPFSVTLSLLTRHSPTRHFLSASLCLLPFAYCLLPFAYCPSRFQLGAWSLYQSRTDEPIQPKKLTNSRTNPRFGFTFGLQTISLITACSSQLGNLTQLRQSCQILWGSVALSICRNPCRLKYSGM